MKTKLTLLIKNQTVNAAKQIAMEKGQSLSELVENYFISLPKIITSNKSDNNFSRIKSLKGMLKITDDFDYKIIIEEEILKKHG